MEASLGQIITLALMVIAVLGFSFFAYYISLKVEKIWFFVYAMLLIVLVQFTSDTGAFLTFQNYFLHLSSIILFPSVIFCLYIVYALQGGSSARQMLYLLLAGELGYITIVVFLYLLGSNPSYLTVNLSWIRNHLFSSLAIVVDYFALLSTWPLIHNAKFKLPLFFKVAIIFWLLLILDSLIFTLGTFWGNLSITDILRANFTIRSIITLIVSPLITIYIYNQKFRDSSSLVYRTWNEFVSKAEYEKEIDLSKQKIDQLVTLENELAQKNQELESQRLALSNVLADVQEEKDIARSQAIELRRYRTAVEQSNDMMIFTDPEGVVIWANPATELVTGFTVAESIGRKAGILWGKLMSKDWYQSLWHTIKFDKKIFTGEIENHRKSGERFMSNITVYPLLDDHQNVQFFVATQRDITHEREVDRMKTDFISLASHQLRTPLSAMKWFLEMLLASDFGQLSPKQLDAVKNIEQSNERMIALVNSLLNISRIESGRIIIEPEPTSINDLASSVITELEPTLHLKSQKINLTTPSDLPQINLDQKLVRQVFLNLLTNASKYSPASTPIELNIKKEETEITVQISDHGYGIPEAEQKRVFHRFFRASNIIKLETDGTGLGLYLVKTIVESSGGKIRFESTENQGTSFWFTIPLAGVAPKPGQVRLN